MSTYSARPLRVRFTSGNTDGLAEFPDGSDSDADGILIPRFSTSERDALATSKVYQGLIIFNDSTSTLQIYTGSDGSNNSSSWGNVTVNGATTATILALS